MQSPIIETRQLYFAFQTNQKILDDLNLQVPAGSIYGFLGPNGAGKTTTLRLILGLLRKQQGDITLFGKHLQANRIDILRRIGSLIEQPSLYLHLTVKENLEVFRLTYQVNKNRIEEVLQVVQLQHAAQRKVTS